MEQHNTIYSRGRLEHYEACIYQYNLTRSEVVEAKMMKWFSNSQYIQSGCVYMATDLDDNQREYKSEINQNFISKL